MHLYDTTLRDGAQRKGLSFSLEDKLKVARLLDSFGISYIEGGWPGSNPKDMEFFQRIKQTPLSHARVVAFGSTCRVGAQPENDPNLRALIEAGVSTVAIVGKSSSFHVEKVLGTTCDENLRMIRESVAFLKRHDLEVIFDAEHFFDGYKSDPLYATSAVKAAADCGADWIVLCDTNGGSLPHDVEKVVRRMVAFLNCPIGVHCHNDGELAVANSIAAARAGARQIQGTINGYGERCGNANLVSLLPTLQLKMGFQCVPADRLSKLTELSKTVSEIGNLSADPHAPYVGAAAFAHKAGLHVAAVEKATASYEHIDPAAVGNSRQILVSELSGRGNIRMLAGELGVKVAGQEQTILSQVKQLEEKGYQFESAEGTVELMLRRGQQGYGAPFELVDMTLFIRDSKGMGMSSEAVVKLKVGNVVYHTACEGNGPVNALDKCLRKALQPSYPQIEQVRLADYKVRILDPDQATQATTRVIIEATDGEQTWSTVGCSTNIIDASYQALADSFELYLIKLNVGAPCMSPAREVVA